MARIPFTGGGKRRGSPYFVAFVVVVLALGLGGLWKALDVDSRIASSVGAVGIETPESQQQEVLLAAVSAADIQACNGVQSVNWLYNDIDELTPSTDPNVNSTTVKPFTKSITDDATSTTLPIKSEVLALHGNTNGLVSSQYFAQEETIQTQCADFNDQPRLARAGAGVMSWTNQNGNTANTNATHEVISASGTVSPCVTIRSPSNRYSCKYGCALIANYDNTYVNKIVSGDLASYTGQIRENKQSGFNTTADTTTGFLLDGELKDGDKVEACFDITATSTASEEGNSDIIWALYPLNKDLNENLDGVDTGIYDWDNNFISIGNTTSHFHTGD